MWFCLMTSRAGRASGDIKCCCGGHSGAAGSICGVFVVQDDDMTIAANRVGWELGAGKGVRSALSPAGRNTRGLV